VQRRGPGATQAQELGSHSAGGQGRQGEGLREFGGALKQSVETGGEEAAGPEGGGFGDVVALCWAGGGDVFGVGGEGWILGVGGVGVSIIVYDIRLG